MKSCQPATSAICWKCACRTFQAENDFASASKVADLYVKLAPTGKGRELPAEVAAAWGQSLWKEAEVKTGPTAAHGRDEARLQFRKAGGLFAEAATAQRPVSEQVDCLGRAADQYFKAADKLDLEAGNVLLERIEKLDPVRAVDGEAAMCKAMSLQNLGEKARAIEEYRKIAQQAESRHAPARLLLAILQAKNLPPSKEDAKALLVQIVKDLEKNNDPTLAEKDHETHELSLYWLGFTVYDLRDYLKAESYLETALHQYPLSSQARNARFMLGRCSWYQAARERQLLSNKNLQDKERAETDKRFRDFLSKGRDAFEQVEKDLLVLEKEAKLPEAEKPLLRQASFAAADCYFFLGDCAEAARRYKDLRIKYEGTISEIVALSQLWQCYEVYLSEHEKAAATFEAMRDALKKVPDAEFDGTTPYNKRDFWENWLKDVANKMVKSAAAAQGAKE